MRRAGVVLAALVLSLGSLLVLAGGYAPAQGLTTSASNLLDKIGSTRGSVLYRGASGWAALTPGSSGSVLLSGGAGADPSWGGQAAGGITSYGWVAGTTFQLSGANAWETVPFLGGGSVATGGWTLDPSGTILTVGTAGTYWVHAWVSNRNAQTVNKALGMRLLSAGTETAIVQMSAAGATSAAFIYPSTASGILSLSAGGTITLQVGGYVDQTLGMYDDGSMPAFSASAVTTQRITWIRLGD